MDLLTKINENKHSNERFLRAFDYLCGLNGVTAGQLAVSIFGLSGQDEWVTNIGIKAQDADGSVIGSASITGAPFKANRSTEYSGNLFGSAGGLDVNVDGAWETSHAGTW